MELASDFLCLRAQDGVVSFFSAEFDPENAEPVATFKGDDGELLHLSSAQITFLRCVFSSQSLSAVRSLFPTRHGCSLALALGATSQRRSTTAIRRQRMAQKQTKRR